MKALHITLSMVIALTLSTSNASAQDSCTLPSNWIPHNLTTRVEEAHNVVYAKVIEKKNFRQVGGHGEMYDISLELECDVKVQRGIIIPEIFTVFNMGAMPESCPQRNVETYQYYILFLQKDDNGNFVLEEVNQQDGVVLASWDNLKVLFFNSQYNIDEPGSLNPLLYDKIWVGLGVSGIKLIKRPFIFNCFVCLFFQLISGPIQKCLTDLCNPAVIDGWSPMTEMERADVAEIIVHVKVTDTHETSGGYYFGNSQLICGMKVPSDINLGTSFNITQLGESEGTFGQCADDHVTKNHEFIIFLERHFPFFPPLVGTLSPELQDDFLLGVDEVNFQQGIWNVTDEVKEIFKDYLVDCPSSGNSLFRFQHMFGSVLFSSVIFMMFTTYFL